MQAEEKDHLIAELCNSNELEVQKALGILRKKGWLEDGSLRKLDLQTANFLQANLISADLTGCNLYRANLKQADLVEANLQDTDLSEANLENTLMCLASLQGANLDKASLKQADLRCANLENTRNLTDAQFLQVHVLRHAIMPDGTIYDGRYNLAGDLDSATRHGMNTGDPEKMAAWFEVSPEVYLAGQQWAEGNLPRPKKRSAGTGRRQNRSRKT